jgi:MoaA/NifB/PqqE/SkfB family radical SAM enzyme
MLAMNDLAASLLGHGRALTNSLSGLLGRGRAPLYVSWVVTNYCNLRCEYCACPDIASKELKTAQCLKLIEEMAQAGTHHIKFTGGEPLVRKDLPLLLVRANQLGLKTSLNSNGTLIPAKLDELRTLSAVSLSLDGPSEVHEMHRGKGQTEEVLEACRSLKDAGIAVTLQCLVTSRTTHACVDYVLGVAEQFNAKATFQPALDIELGTTNPNPVAPDAAHVRQIMVYIDDCREQGRPVGQSKAGLASLATYPQTQPLRCVVGRVACRLDPNGNMTPCHERSGELPPVNAAELGFAQAFDRLEPAQCTECWGSGRVEMRMATSLKPSAVLNMVGL